MLEEMPLPGFPKDEAERRRLWAGIPRVARAAIRRLHIMLGHKPKEVLIQILRGSRAPQAYIDAVRYFRCDACAVTARDPKTHPVSAPSPYAFNHELHIDIFTIHDYDGNAYQFLSVVDCGTTFHQAYFVMAEKGTPSSQKCLSKFVTHWVSWAGWPKIITTDRGTHNKGVFRHVVEQNGVYMRTAGVESPEQLGRGERHGDILKTNLKKCTREHNIAGKHMMKIAVAESCACKNESAQRGGFTPTQWVLGRAPRGVGRMLDDEELGHLGVLEGQLNGETEFALRSKIKYTARKEYVKQDCSSRHARAMLRRAAPIPMVYQAGDMVCFRRERRKAEKKSNRADSRQESTVWSTPSRIIGFEGKTVWVICEGIPYATSLRKLRPCTASEILAHEVIARGYEFVGQDQQGFVDARNAPDHYDPAEIESDKEDEEDDIFEPDPPAVIPIQDNPPPNYIETATDDRVVRRRINSHDESIDAAEESQARRDTVDEPLSEEHIASDIAEPTEAEVLDTPVVEESPSASSHAHVARINPITCSEEPINNPQDFSDSDDDLDTDSDEDDGKITLKRIKRRLYKLPSFGNDPDGEGEKRRVFFSIRIISDGRD